MEAAAEAMGLRLPAHLAAELEPPEIEDDDPEEIPTWWFDRNAGPEPMKRYEKRGAAGSDSAEYFDAYNERRRRKYAELRKEGMSPKEARRASAG
jgi:hypothetical protein